MDQLIFASLSHTHYWYEVLLLTHYWYEVLLLNKISAKLHRLKNEIAVCIKKNLSIPQSGGRNVKTFIRWDHRLQGQNFLLCVVNARHRLFSAVISLEARV